MRAVSEPLHEIERNIIIMSTGDFSPLEGDYPGIFGVLQKTCNIVNTTTEAYIDEIARILDAIAKRDL